MRKAEQNMIQRRNSASLYRDMSSHTLTIAAPAGNGDYHGYASRYYSADPVVRKPLSKKARLARKQARRRAAMIRRTLAAVLGAIIIFFFGLCIGNSHPGAANQPVYKYYTTVTVEPGDTIWNLSDQFIDSSEVNKNEYVNEICRMNHLSDGTIRPGDCITMIYYSTEVKR